MAINIQNIIDQITTKAAAADSSMDADYLLTLSKSVLAMNQATGVIEYRYKNLLPDVDSSILGNFAYIPPGSDIDSVYGDSYGAFFYAARIGLRDSAWDRIRTGVDSDAENGGGASGIPFQGSSYGYTSGGGQGNPSARNYIQKWPFSTDANPSDIADLPQTIYNAAGSSSATDAYTSGGRSANYQAGVRNNIMKFPFAVDENASFTGYTLTVARQYISGQSSISEGYGYASGGGNIIDKFSFQVDANATDVGDLTASKGGLHAGISSSTNGYVAETSTIDKFPFATDANATDVGDLSVVSVALNAGSNSDVSGYSSGGYGYPGIGRVNTIQKFPFATDGNTTDVGDLTQIFQSRSGHSSTTHGYSFGGYGPSGNSAEVEKFSFATDANGTYIGNMKEVGTGFTPSLQV